ncbi:hypothetical protein EDD11_007450 [Mortierella claussenii]|nr:hypothetical protein EDD11_007450 [Mortierella claussenii]
MSTSLAISTPDGESITSSDDTFDNLMAGLSDEIFSSVLDELTKRLADIPVDVALEDRVDEAILDDDEPMVYNDESPLTPTRADIVPLPETRAELDARAKARIREALRDSLFSDPYIVATAEELAIPSDDLMRWEDRRHPRDYSNFNLLVFVLKESYFKDWKHRHEVSIGTSFTSHGVPLEYRTDPLKDSGFEDTESTRSRIGHTIARYYCHRKGSPKVFKNRVLGGKSGKTRVRKEPLPCNCPSYFNAIFQPGFRLGNGKVTDLYRIEYRLDHCHQLGKEDSIGTLQKSKAIRDRIKAMLMRGMSISAIMTQLTMDHAKFTRLMDGTGINSSFAQDDCITYDDVYNIYYALTAKRIRKDDNAFKSARLWMEELHNRGYFTYYDKVRGLYHGFSSPWQLNELHTYLFTIVVKNRDTGFGIRVAFLLTKIAQCQVLEGWLRALKAKMDELCVEKFEPAAVITDQGQTEINAIQAVWPLGLRIFYCAWHVLQAWERKLTPQNLGSSNLDAEIKEERKLRVRTQLCSILYARTEGDAEALIAAFRDSWQGLAPRFVQYMDKYYFNSDSDKRRWMYCYREGVSDSWINTSNYIESWHNTLKQHFFKDKTERRIDAVIYTLVHRALPHYEQRCIRYEVQVRRMVSTVKDTLITKNTALDHMDLKRTQDPETSFLIPTADPLVFLVESFQGLPITYELPHKEFSHAGHWELQDSSSLEDLPAHSVASAAATATEPAATLLFRHYVEAIYNVMNTMDGERAITNHEEE